MGLNKIVLGIICIMLSAESIAGVAKLTIHSRANCGNNESISWHLGHSYWLLTVSDHLQNGKKQHSLAAPWELTWRSANVHWLESKIGRTDWSVQAGHYISENGQPRLLGFTTATNCNVYNGWWDY